MVGKNHPNDLRHLWPPMFPHRRKEPQEPSEGDQNVFISGKLQLAMMSSALHGIITSGNRIIDKESLEWAIKTPWCSSLTTSTRGADTRHIGQVGGLPSLTEEKCRYLNCNSCHYVLYILSPWGLLKSHFSWCHLQLKSTPLTFGAGHIAHWHLFFLLRCKPCSNNFLFLNICSKTYLFL